MRARTTPARTPPPLTPTPALTRTPTLTPTPSPTPAPRQISNVLRARSAEGLSATAFELETWALLVHAGYGYVTKLPFSSYGEAALMLAQNLLLLVLVYRYGRAPAGRVAAVLGLIVAAIAVIASGALGGGGLGVGGWGLGSRVAG